MISQHLLLTGCQRRIISTRGSTFSPNKFPPKSIVHGKVAPAIYELEKEVTKVKDARGTRGRGLPSDEFILGSVRYYAISITALKLFI